MFMPDRCKPRRFILLPSVFCLSVIGLSALTGCGGGGKTGVPVVSNPSPGTPATSSIVSGAVTDINGAPIVGAKVTIGSLTATTSQGGAYAISNVVVPANQASLITAASATATVNGVAFSGQNTVEVLTGEANTTNVNIVISNSAAQGSISGTVRDVGNTPLANARVFVAPGPVQQSNGGLAFTNFGSFAVYTDNSGRYVVPKLPYLPAGQTYTATASYVGHLNQTVSNLVLPNTAALSNGNLTGVDFAITASTTSPVLPAVKNFAAVGFTFPSVPTRSLTAQANTHPFDAIKSWVLKSRGLTQQPYKNASKMWTRALRTRATPAGLLIETDLLWDYEASLNNLLGYSIVRSTGNPNTFVDIATLRDPLADRFDDLDPLLTPGTSYYYNVGRLDTINFPNGSDASSSVAADVTVQVTPLDAITVQQPAPNATVGATPTITWNAVTNAGSLSGTGLRPLPGLSIKYGGRGPHLAARPRQSRHESGGRAHHAIDLCGTSLAVRAYLLCRRSGAVRPPREQFYGRLRDLDQPDPGVYGAVEIGLHQPAYKTPVGEACGQPSCGRVQTHSRLL